MSSSSDGHRPQGFFSRGKFLEKCPQSCFFFHGFMFIDLMGCFFGGGKKSLRDFCGVWFIRVMNVHM